MRLAGAVLVATGLVLAAYASYPWIYLQFIQPRRYHYHYIRGPGPSVVTSELIIAGSLAAIGIWLATKPHSRP